MATGVGVRGWTVQAVSTASPIRLGHSRFTPGLYRDSNAGACYTGPTFRAREGPVRYSSPPNPKEYADQVYAIVRRIPAGKVATYGQVAWLIPPPAGVNADEYRRVGAIWVGGAMANAPDDVPWQRVINSQGKISQRPGLGPAAQRQLLEQEGVVFDARERVDLKKFGWDEDADAEQPALF